MVTDIKTSILSSLSADHFEEIIVRSAISPDVAEARGYRTLHGTQGDRAELTEIGFARNVTERDETYPALLIPIFRATGEIITHQLKPHIPRAMAREDGSPRVVKYENPRGSQNHLDVPVFTQNLLQENTKHYLWVTEGIKKVDSLISQGRATVGLTGVFNWRRKLGTLGDWEDVPLKGREVVICFDADASDNRNVQLAMRRFGAWLTSKGSSKIHYLIVPGSFEGEPVKGVDDWFSVGGDLSGLKEATSLTPPGEGPKDASFTDAILSESVCEDVLEGRFCWARGLGWMAWNGYVWKEVADTGPTEAVRVWAIEQFQGVLEKQKSDTSRDQGSLIAGWRSVLSKGRIKALVDLARGILEKDASDFDADPDLLGVKNGYVDLRTGTLHSPDPDRFMTKCAGTDYKQGATHPLWNKALEAVPTDILPWYQDRIGQAATGYMTPDDSLVISHGDGSNGKSTVVLSIQTALGTYAVLLSDRVLMAAPDAHPTELMDLRGARYATLEETPEARRLDTHRLKRTVGTPKINARLIRQNGVQFDTTHSLFVNTNFKPIVTETDHGTWRRLALMTFPYTYRAPGEAHTGPRDRTGDPRIRDPRTQTDAAFRRAVLAWVVEGARAWYARDRVMLPTPDRVRRDTLAWRGETDLILAFAREMLRFANDARVGAREMLGAFNEWIEHQGHKPWTEKTFAARFATHDLIKGHRVEKSRVRGGGAGAGSRGVMTWTGVTLGDDDEGDPLDIFGPSSTPPDLNPEAESAEKPPETAFGQGGQASPDYREFRPITSVNKLACPPCPDPVPPEVNGVQGQNGLRRSGPDRGENDSEEAEMIIVEGTEPPVVTEREENLAPDSPALSDAPCPASASDSAPGAQVDSGGLCVGGGHPSTPTPTSGPHGPVYGFDLESRGRNWLNPPGGDGFVTVTGWGGVTETGARGLVGALRAGGTWVGAHVLGFDLPVLERHHGLRVEETAGRMRDTQLQAMLADPPTSLETHSGPHFKSYSLNAVSHRVLGEPKDERGKILAGEFCTVPRCSHGKSAKCDGWENIPPSDPRLHAYCSDDEQRAVRIHNALPWTPYMEREMRVQAIMTRMTLNGFRVDEELLDTRVRDGRKRKADAVRELKDRFGMPTERIIQLKTKTRVEPFLSPLATKEGKAWLENVYAKYGVVNPPRTEKSKDLATGAEVLKTISEHPRCPQELRHILNLMGIVTSERTIYETVRDNVVNGRVHPYIWPRQASGRWSVEVGMTVMKKEEREVYIPDLGESIITVDLAQVDARVVAANAQDPAYLELFAPGRDIHTETAIALLGDAKYRPECKPIAHAANYGANEKRLIQMGHNPQLVRQLLMARAEKFPGLLRWQNNVREIGSSGELLNNGFGRPLRVEKLSAYTQAPAAVGQSGTRDLMARGLLRLAEVAPECLSMLRMIVHDEVVLSVPTEHAEEISRTVVKAFELDWAPEGASRTVRIIAESSRPGNNWYDAYRK